MLVQLPRDAQDPAGFCARVGLLQRAAGEGVPVPGPPVLWLAPRAVQLRRPLGPPLSQGLPHAPLWWAGEQWREFGAAPVAAAHAQAHAAYVPRRFEPPWRCGSVLLRPSEAPLEAGPQEVGAQEGGSGVLRLLKVLLCERQGRLWTKPATGGEWSECPYEIEFHLARTEALELRGGDRYVFLFRGRGGGGGGIDSVLFYGPARNQWGPLPTARPTATGNLGEVRWQGLRGPKPAPGPLKAWVLDATADYLVLLAPVSRDGLQRGNAAQDVHSALHFLGIDGKEVVHHLPCHSAHLMVQRYDQYLLFVKDFDEDAGDEASHMRDDNLPEFANTAAWLLAVEDVAVPPMPVFLPFEHAEWTGQPWSLVLARGSVEVSPQELRLDTAPRIYLLEEGPVMRLWCTRRVDDLMDSVHHRHTLDGFEVFRHVLSFSPLLWTEIEVGGEEDLPGSWLLWSPDLRHALRIAAAGAGNGKMGVWRCGVAFAGEPERLKASQWQALKLAPASFTHSCPVESIPLGRGAGWLGPSLPAEDARRSRVTGLPCFPALVQSDSYELHPCGRDAAHLPPLMVLR
ncbi:unnamed protein product [Polarella glacialis]|uniref:Uncharacterized protein n=1 Tax=Polarella glacialis TaxID=89957 RepID=A0A813E569_POLGL|nr:unnamed protein product [Polarella glacialis]